MIYKIRDYRKEMNMTQSELSKKAGVSRTIISGLERGTISVTTTDTIAKIARALGKTVKEILLE